MKEKNNFLATKKNFFIVFLLLFISGFSIVAGKNKTNFFWVGNNLYESGEKSYATIGMIKPGGNNFGITAERIKNNAQILKGSAWMGIGSEDDKAFDFSDQGDHPSLGWIKFNEGYPNFCGSDKICSSVAWNRKVGAGDKSLEGYLSGWAKFEIGKNGDGTDYPETWIYFNPPKDLSSFQCDSRVNLNKNKDFYACTDENGYLFGYGWSSEAKANSLTDNAGFGWINFPGVSFNNCEEGGVCNLECSYDPDCCRSEDYLKNHDQCKLCEVDNQCNFDCLFDPDCCEDLSYAESHQKCVSSEGRCNIYRVVPAGNEKIKAGSTVKYRVLIVGGEEPEKIFYKCTDDSLEREIAGKRDIVYECDTYSLENSSYISSVRYLYKKSDGMMQSTDCANVVTVETEGVSSNDNKDCFCDVKIKKANTTGQKDNEWAQSVNLEENFEEVEARVQSRGENCSEEKAVFEINNMTNISHNDNYIKFILKDGISHSFVKASLKDKNGATINCGSAEIRVKEKMGWR